MGSRLPLNPAASKRRGRHVNDCPSPLFHRKRNRVVLALIGPGSETARDEGGRRLHDPADWNRAEFERTTVEHDIRNLSNSIALAMAQSKDTKDLDARKSRKENQFAEINAMLAPRHSTWFIHDILTDPSNGYSLHRLQMFVESGSAVGHFRVLGVERLRDAAI